jgi:peptidoglycan/LPS O-acetylase OafA/YrhL
VTQKQTADATGQERLAALDLLRGIAALSVLALHLPWPGAHGVPLPRGYLAVDLFFLLSGFVIAHAYSHRLETWALFKQFCVARLIRLYPLYCIATLIAAAEMLAYARFGRGADPHATVGNVMRSLAPAILILPTPSRWSVEPSTFFPLVFSAWSLFWEFLVNLLFGIAGTRLRPSVLVLMMAGGAAGIALAEYRYGVAGGTSWDGAWVGGARALFSFFAGVALFRVRQCYHAPAVPAALLAALLLLAFVPAKFGSWAYDLTCMAFVFPLLIWFGAEAAMGPKVRAAGTFLGFLSYPVYLLQAPLLLWLAPMWVRLEHIVPLSGLSEPLVDFAVIILGSWLVARWFDLPVRERLRRRLVPQAPTPPAQSAP